MLGAAEGGAEGDELGLPDGRLDGVAEGRADGEGLGKSEGNWVGVSDGGLCGNRIRLWPDIKPLCYNVSPSLSFFLLSRACWHQYLFIVVFKGSVSLMKTNYARGVLKWIFWK